MRGREVDLNLTEKTAIANKFFDHTPNYARGELPINSETSKCLRACLDIYLENVEANQFHDHWKYFNRLCHSILNLHQTGEKLKKEDILKAIGICCTVINDGDDMTREIGDSLIKLLAILIEDLKDSSWEVLYKNDLLTLISNYAKIKMDSKNYEMASEIADHFVTLLDTYGDGIMDDFDLDDYAYLIGSFCHVIINQTNDEIVRSFCIRLVGTLYSLKNQEETKMSSVLTKLRRSSQTEDDLIEHLTLILRKIYYAHRYHTQLWILKVVFTLIGNFDKIPIRVYDEMMNQNMAKRKAILPGIKFNFGKVYELREQFLEIRTSSTFESIESLHGNFDNFLLFLNNKTRNKTPIFTVAGKVAKINDTTVNEDYGLDGIEFNSLAGCVSFTVDLREMSKVFASASQEFTDCEGEAYFEAFYENFETNESDDDTMEITLNLRRLLYKQGLYDSMKEIPNITQMLLLVGDARPTDDDNDVPDLKITASKNLIEALQEKISTKPVNLDASIVSVRANESRSSIVSAVFTPSVVQNKRKRPKRDLSVAKKALNFNAMEDTPEDVPNVAKKALNFNAMKDTPEDVPKIAKKSLNFNAIKDTPEDVPKIAKRALNFKAMEETPEDVPKIAEKMEINQDEVTPENAPGKENEVPQAPKKTRKRLSMGSVKASEIDEFDTPKSVLSPAQNKMNTLKKSVESPAASKSDDTPVKRTRRARRRLSVRDHLQDSIVVAETSIAADNYGENMDHRKVAPPAPRRSTRISAAANKSKDDSMSGKSIKMSGDNLNDSVEKKDAPMSDKSVNISGEKLNDSAENKDESSYFDLFKSAPKIEVEEPIVEEEPKPKRKPRINWSPENANQDVKVDAPKVKYPPWPEPYGRGRMKPGDKIIVRSLTEEEIQYYENIEANERKAQASPIKQPPKYNMDLPLEERCDIIPWWRAVREAQANNVTPPIFHPELGIRKPDNLVAPAIEQHAANLRYEDRCKSYAEWYDAKAMRLETSLKNTRAIVDAERKEREEKKLEARIEQGDQNFNSTNDDFVFYDKHGIKGKVWKPQPQGLDNSPVSYERFLQSIEGSKASNKKSKCYDPVDKSNASDKKQAEDAFELDDENEMQPTTSKSIVKKESAKKTPKVTSLDLEDDDDCFLKSKVKHSTTTKPKIKKESAKKTPKMMNFDLSDDDDEWQPRTSKSTVKQRPKSAKQTPKETNIELNLSVVEQPGTSKSQVKNKPDRMTKEMKNDEQRLHEFINQPKIDEDWFKLYPEIELKDEDSFELHPYWIEKRKRKPKEEPKEKEGKKKREKTIPMSPPKRPRERLVDAKTPDPNWTGMSPITPTREALMNKAREDNNREILRRKEDKAEKQWHKDEFDRQVRISNYKMEHPNIIERLGGEHYADPIYHEEIKELTRKKYPKRTTTPTKKKDKRKKPEREISIPKQLPRLNAPPPKRTKLPQKPVKEPTRARLPRACKEAAKERLVNCDLSPIKSVTTKGSDEDENVDEDEKFVTALNFTPRKSNSPVVEPQNDIYDITDANEQYITALDIVPRKSNSFEENSKVENQLHFANEGVTTVIEKPLISPKESAPNASSKRKSENFDDGNESPKKQKLDDEPKQDDKKQTIANFPFTIYIDPGFEEQPLDKPLQDSKKPKAGDKALRTIYKASPKTEKLMKKKLNFANVEPELDYEQHAIFKAFEKYDGPILDDEQKAVVKALAMKIDEQPLDECLDLYISLHHSKILEDEDEEEEELLTSPKESAPKALSNCKSEDFADGHETPKEQKLDDEPKKDDVQQKIVKKPKFTANLTKILEEEEEEEEEVLASPKESAPKSLSKRKSENFDDGHETPKKQKLDDDQQMQDDDQQMQDDEQQMIAQVPPLIIKVDEQSLDESLNRSKTLEEEVQLKMSQLDRNPMLNRFINDAGAEKMIPVSELIPVSAWSFNEIQDYINKGTHSLCLVKNENFKI